MRRMLALNMGFIWRNTLATESVAKRPLSARSGLKSLFFRVAVTDSSAYNESFNPLSLPASSSSFKTLLVRSNIWRA